jgi:dihydroorotate dehydrogenase (fumarate)
MNLSTTYMGLRLAHPFMAGASPLAATLAGARRLEEAGSAAIVLPSLFEEGVIGGEIAVRSFYQDHDYVSSLETIPVAAALGLSPRDYLAHLAKVKKAVRIPVIASLNGTAPGGWIKYASVMENEGADALELNLYTFATEPWDPSEAAERRMLELVRSLRASVHIPIAVKLSPFYTSLPHFVRELDQAGANAVLLFNRFYQADIDLEQMVLVRTLQLSSSSELLLRLRWLAVLHGRITSSLGVTGGVHTAEDALKAILSGAHVVQVVSALLEKGPEYLETLRLDMEVWLRNRHIDSLEDLRGRMSLLRAPNPKAYERMNYIYNLDSWYGPISDPAVSRHGG